MCKVIGLTYIFMTIIEIDEIGHSDRNIDYEIKTKSNGTGTGL